MNERIRELAEQAMVTNNRGDGYYNRILDPEKFAELIVKECTGVLVAEMNRLDGLDRVVAAQTLDTAQVLIKQHFGVES